MIKTLRLRNFKAFKDTGEIELKPITVLAGPNSGGKSSILQSLLLLKQTLKSDIEVDLNLDGEYLQASSLSDITYGKPAPEDCNISYTIGFESEISTQLLGSEFSDLKNISENDNITLENTIDFTFCFKEARKGNETIIPDNIILHSGYGEMLNEELSVKYRDKRSWVSFGNNNTILNKLYSDIDNITVRGIGFIPSVLIFPFTDDPSKGVDDVRIEPIPDILNIPLKQLRYLLTSNIKYLSHLRNAPQRAYLRSGSPSPDLGKSGEYAPQILWLERGKIISYYPDYKATKKESNLLEAVNDMFGIIGINQKIDVKSQESIMYQILFDIKANDKRKFVSITDVGFGLHQILPIILLGLRSPDDSLLLFEQPEIHLHPKLQANLADFFLTLTRSGKRILVETHSDHFINRLRRRIAEDKTDTLKDIINILFVRPPANGEGAVIEPLEVDRFGVIKNWPPDFLPEAANEAEAIFKAGIKKRMEEKEC